MKLRVILFLYQLYKHYGKCDDRPNEYKNELNINWKKIPGHIRVLGEANWELIAYIESVVDFDGTDSVPTKAKNKKQLKDLFFQNSIPNGKRFRELF